MSAIISKAKVRKALIAAGGVTSEAAKTLGVTRQRVWMRVRDNPDLKALVEELQGAIAPLAKLTVHEAIIAGDVETAKWYLSRVDSDFKNTVGVRLGDAELAAIIAALGNDPDALRKLAGA